MKQVRELRAIAEDLVAHLEMRTHYVRGLPKDVHHIDIGRQILGTRISQIVEGTHRPFDVVELLDTVIASAAHFAVAKDATWGIAGPQLVEETPLSESAGTPTPIEGWPEDARPTQSDIEKYGRRGTDGAPTTEPGAVLPRGESHGQA